MRAWEERLAQVKEADIFPFLLAFIRHCEHLGVDGDRFETMLEQAREHIRLENRQAMLMRLENLPQGKRRVIYHHASDPPHEALYLYPANRSGLVYIETRTRRGTRAKVCVDPLRLEIP